MVMPALHLSSEVISLDGRHLVAFDRPLDGLRVNDIEATQWRRRLVEQLQISGLDDRPYEVGMLL